MILVFMANVNYKRLTGDSLNAQRIQIYAFQSENYPVVNR
jgi:hypothetical protein